ncbi:Lysophospholipase; Monoglyceride lipase; putative [plant metagenome]|uniref:Lysophospholipase Monoglyceride lipase putative n=1 Tax=plant metagenome TaxID=1297885 RepID=A0A484QPK2_9ZZZZ
MHLTPASSRHGRRDTPKETGLSPISMTDTPDGMQLACYRWEPDPAVAHGRGIYMLHGLGEHAGRHDRLACWLADRGWQVAAHDHRGHGRSTGHRATLRHPDDLVEDAVRQLRAWSAELAQPPVLLGHSLGGLLAARIGLRGDLPLDGLVLASPPFQVTLPAWKTEALKLLANWAPDLRVGHGLRTLQISHDPIAVRAYYDDPLVHDRMTGKLARFIHDAGAQALADAPTLRWRTLLLVAGADAIVDPAGSRAFADHAPPGMLALRWYDRAWHELFNETPELAAPVYADLDHWLAQFPQGAPVIPATPAANP